MMVLRLFNKAHETNMPVGHDQARGKARSGDDHLNWPVNAVRVNSCDQFIYLRPALAIRAW